MAKETHLGFNVLELQLQDMTAFYMENKDVYPDQVQYQLAAEYMTKRSGVSISVDDAEMIIGFYPYQRVGIALSMDPEITDCHDWMDDMLAHFFLRCEWPGPHDVDMDEFQSILENHAVAVGFTRA